MHPTKNDLPQKTRVKVAAVLADRLADATDLMLQTKQAHWNVKGPSFIALHELFDKINDASEDWVDMIAERIVQLGGQAEGTLQAAAARNAIEKTDRLGDKDTADLFTEVSRDVDKYLWFVEAHNQRAE